MTPLHFTFEPIAIPTVDIHRFANVTQVFKRFCVGNHIVLVKLSAKIFERNPWLPSPR